jgi:uncharacterized protein (TIGR03083 family)
MTKRPELDVVELLPLLDDKLMELMRSLSREDWQKQTVAKRWKVKDVVAHLLDGNVRILSMLRDGYSGEHPEIVSYQDLLDFLNRLNAEWVTAMTRVSPEMLIVLHEATGKAYCDYYRSLDPYEKAGFSVDWAGESESRNWMHIAREYTEKWLHQQQIREATLKPGLMTREYFYPFISIFMLALPYTYRNMIVENGTAIRLIVTTDIGGSWVLLRANDKWVLNPTEEGDSTTEVIIDPETSWKLFSKSLRPDEIRDRVTIIGDRQLGEVALNMVSVMA